MKIKLVRGFTLIELLVVISIIGLLAAIGTFSITYTQARARDAKRVANLDQFMKALNLYVTSHDAYPVSVSGLCVDGTDAVSLALQADQLLSTSIKEPLYTDPAKCFKYTTDADGTTFSIQYYLETNSVGPKGVNKRP